MKLGPQSILGWIGTAFLFAVLLFIFLAVILPTFPIDFDAPPKRPAHSTTPAPQRQESASPRRIGTGQQVAGREWVACAFIGRLRRSHGWAAFLRLRLPGLSRIRHRRIHAGFSKARGPILSSCLRIVPVLGLLAAITCIPLYVLIVALTEKIVVEGLWITLLGPIRKRSIDLRDVNRVAWRRNDSVTLDSAGRRQSYGLPPIDSKTRPI